MLRQKICEKLLVEDKEWNVFVLGFRMFKFWTSIFCNCPSPNMIKCEENYNMIIEYFCFSKWQHTICVGLEGVEQEVLEQMDYTCDGCSRPGDTSLSNVKALKIPHIFNSLYAKINFLVVLYFCLFACLVVIPVSTFPIT